MAALTDKEKGKVLFKVLTPNEQRIVFNKAFKLRNFDDGNYSSIIMRDFPTRQFLPIIAQDFQYAKDVMYIHEFGVEKEDVHRV